MACSFDGDRQRPLVLGAGALLSPGLDLASLRDVAAQAGQILVVDLANVVEAEGADLPPRGVATSATATRSPATGPIVSATPAAARAAKATTAAAAEPRSRLTAFRAGPSAWSTCRSLKPCVPISSVCHRHSSSLSAHRGDLLAPPREPAFVVVVLKGDVVEVGALIAST